MSCRCLSKINDKLFDMGFELDLVMNVKGLVLPHLAVIKIARTRKRLPLVIPNNCPFCGRAYRKLERKKSKCRENS